MFLFKFYRFYTSLLFAGSVYFLAVRSLWTILFGTFFFRTCWYIIELQIKKIKISKWFATHSSQFKELTGPYGVRLINKSESDRFIKESLSEVFTPNINHLKKAVEQLELMDTLFKSGLKPDGDSYQLHDLKLKYGKYRLEKNRQAK